MAETALEPGRTYLLRHGPEAVQARVEQVLRRVDMDSLNREPAASLGLNEIGTVIVETARPLVFDRYTENRQTGGFILIDPLSNLTVGAGMIERGLNEERRGQRGAGGGFLAGRVTAAERRERSGHGPGVVLLDAGSEVADGLERRLFERGADVVSLARPGAALAALLGAGFLVIAGEAGDCEPCLDAGALELPAAPEAAVEVLMNELVRRGMLDDRDSMSAGEGI
jgi:hypothetical protein